MAVAPPAAADGARPAAEPRPADKSPDAFRTISEVADGLHLPQHVLRFWETRFPQIKPLKRGGGRRYYRPDDIDLLRGIRHLLYGEGYTIKGVQRILKAEGLRFVQSIGRGDERAPARLASDADNGADEGDEAEAAEFEPPTPHRDESSQGRSVFAQSDIERLKQALDELVECERVLKTLAVANEPGNLEDAPG
jgi:DNA-binding transcriptional MerR regulator